ncbi:hypothetical protein SKAU_G00315110 [Synaphobranchus kaupii]|uniref:Uncharacterized protein n=1 Tax=Synaphobranchus kaupii TaxID=118154 RepID=A0A9Q1ESJ6_SYNKA|nr:hypothetical protein SKAU_G00315110 [Synaphobranchus kaupii]
MQAAHLLAPWPTSVLWSGAMASPCPSPEEDRWSSSLTAPGLLWQPVRSPAQERMEGRTQGRPPPPPNVQFTPTSPLTKVPTDPPGRLCPCSLFDLQSPEPRVQSFPQAS